jgi:hypothetical protein
MKRVASDEAIEDNSPEDPPQTQRKEGGIDICDLTQLEQLTARFLANPGDKEARAHIERIIHRTYVDNGGISINPQDILPMKINELKPEELVNVIDNMKIHLGRTQKSEFVARCVCLFQNVFKMFSMKKGFVVADEIYNLISTDALLRDALVTSFFGQNVSLRPVPVIGVTLLSHASNLAVAYIENKRNVGSTSSDKQPNSTTNKQPDAGIAKSV